MPYSLICRLQCFFRRLIFNCCIPVRFRFGFLSEFVKLGNCLRNGISIRSGGLAKTSRPRGEILKWARRVFVNKPAAFKINLGPRDTIIEPGLLSTGQQFLRVPLRSD